MGRDYSRRAALKAATLAAMAVLGHGYDDLPSEQNAALRANYKGSYGFREKIDVEGVDHPLRMFDLTEGLIGRGYTDEHITAVLGGNFQRVLGDVWGG